MGERVTEAMHTSWCDGWLLGFIAGFCLKAGRYSQYERELDHYLKRRAALKENGDG